MNRDDTDPTLWNGLAELDESIGLTHNAMVEFLSALRLNPTSTRAMDGLARLARARCDVGQDLYWTHRSRQVSPPPTSSIIAGRKAVVLCAFVAAQGRRDERRRDRVLAVLTLEETAAFEADLLGAERRASLARVISHRDATVTETGSEPLMEAFSGSDASILVLDRVAQGDESIVAQAAKLHGRGVRIRTLSLFYDEWLGKLPLSELERVALMFDIGELHRLRYGRVKRLVDAIAAAVGLLVLVFLVPLVFVANVIGNRGPLFFRQPRVGKSGQAFDIVKFRTMHPGSGDGAWTIDRDARLTVVGRWLRRTHLDEVPQVVNILRGELAIVGPRPEQPHYVELLKEKIPFYDLRHLIRPGLTGWAQVNYPYGGTELDALEKLQYEFYYLRHQSLALDLRIVVRTLRQVVGRGGR
jgi:lipopolysaccharide/colanic/teichoic acid biosynthesis glycosyltransferase